LKNVVIVDTLVEGLPKYYISSTKVIIMSKDYIQK